MTQFRKSFWGRFSAPEFPTGLDWLNVGRPLSMAELKGKVVLLDFWTYGCINCIHVIPDLKKLEEKYSNELIVIGVHSAKFTNEGETENIRRIILRYEIEHPIINDKDFIVWSYYGVRAWPTLVLIDPDGKVLGSHSGEGIYKPFDEVIERIISEFENLRRINRTPLNLKLEKESQLDSPLRFPGKVLADAENDRLFIADSSHNRLVITNIEGIVFDVIGDGNARLKDGSFEEASFFRPQGLTFADDNTVYVADTENHAIRRLDIAERRVTTVAGNGRQIYMRHPVGDALRMPLNSPWDVLYHDGMVYIAMAGQHQLWKYDPRSGVIVLHAGSGREQLKDGPLLIGGLNQPSGLATNGEILYFADSEASAIRMADFKENGELNTVVGTGLFDFGDVDGTGDEVRLQHPLDVAYYNGQLYVADTYNNKIKQINPKSRVSVTFLGRNHSGWQDGNALAALFNEPGGLSIGRNKLFVADTNNHVIRIADFQSREVTTLVLVDSDGLLTKTNNKNLYNGKLLTVKPQTIAEGEGTIQLDIILPDGFKINKDAPSSTEWSVENALMKESIVQFSNEEIKTTIFGSEFPISFPAKFKKGKTQIMVDLVIYYCETQAESLCFIERIRIVIPLTILTQGVDTLSLSYDVKMPLKN